MTWISLIAAVLSFGAGILLGLAIGILGERQRLTRFEPTAKRSSTISRFN